MGRRDEYGTCLWRRFDSSLDDETVFIDGDGMDARAMGNQVPGYLEAMVAVARQFDPGFDAASIEQRPSSGGKYLGLTLTVTATSREMLDELYRTLSTHPMVKVVL